MSGSAQSTVPYLASPALADVLPAHRPYRHLAHYLLFASALTAFLVSAAATIAPQVAQALHRSDAPAASSSVAVTTAAPTIARADLDRVLSFAQTMRTDDTLVQVRSGVFAKRSNAEGVPTNGRTVFYDLMPHQSFGPLRSGRVTESQIDVLARESAGDALIIVYTLK